MQILTSFKKDYSSLKRKKNSKKFSSMVNKFTDATWVKQIYANKSFFKIYSTPSHQLFAPALLTIYPVYSYTTLSLPLDTIYIVANYEIPFLC